MRNCHSAAWLTVWVSMGLFACSDGSDGKQSGGGSGANTGGAKSNGGMTVGGTTVGTSGGGTAAKGGNVGGGTMSGGKTTGGMMVSGGTTTTGGTSSAGGATGGTQATGGTVGGAAGTGAQGGTTPSGGATGGSVVSQGAPLKPRMIALTDISTYETDDWESMTRLIIHADMYEIEGLMLSNGYSLPQTTNPDFIKIIRGVIDAYEKDLPNLLKRSNQVGHATDENKQEIGYWPSPAYLRERTMFGSMRSGISALGATNDSDGSKLIIKLADEVDDPRPIWVTVWGAGNTLAQSIWRVKQDRTPEQLKDFLRKVRIYTITDQDRGAGGSTHGWMRTTAGADLLFIWDECAWHAHNGTGKSNWGQYTTHIQGHGALGGQYPRYAAGVEGDTPSFLYITPTGLNDPDFPNQASWGGTFKHSGNNLWQGASSCGSNFGRFYPAAFNNFAARMDWAKDGAGNRNPIIVLDGEKGVSVLKKSPKAGSQVTLDASKTTDPDGNNLKFNWWIQADAGSYSGKVNIAGSSSNTATVDIPADSAGKNFHVVCEVTDDGTHNLSAYRRIIFEPN